MPLLSGKTLTEAEHRLVAALVRIHRLTALKRIGEHFGISDQWVRMISERYEWQNLEEPLSVIVTFLERRDGKTDLSGAQEPSDEGLRATLKADRR